MQLKQSNSNLGRMCSCTELVILHAVLIVVVWSTNNCRADLATGLQALYTFDSNGNDSSGNGRNLNLIGSPGFAAGQFGQALDLHGNASQYASRSVNDSAFDFGSNNFTIQLWVNFNTVGHVQTLIEKFANQTGPGWTVTTAFAGTKYQFYSNAILNSNFSPTAGVWHDILVERSGSSFGLYVDGSMAASTVYSNALDSSSLPLLIGRRNSGDGRDFSVDGRIDDVAIWNRALTTAEITTLWNGGAGSPILPAVPEPSIFVMSSMLFAMLCTGWFRKLLKRTPAPA
jgi:hypothetical protein